MARALTVPEKHLYLQLPFPSSQVYISKICENRGNGFLRWPEKNGPTRVGGDFSVRKKLFSRLITPRAKLSGQT